MINLQEVRTPRGTTWGSMHAYMVMSAEMQLRESGAAIAERKDVMRKNKRTMAQATRHPVDISMNKGTQEVKLASMYIPPEDS